MSSALFLLGFLQNSRDIPLLPPARYKRCLAVASHCIRIVCPRHHLRYCVSIWRLVGEPTNVSCPTWTVSVKCKVWNRADLPNSLGTIFDFDELLEFAKLGCYLQYDLFGTESSYYQLNSSVDMISDGQRIENIMKLVNEGLVDRLLMSHDIHTKHRLVWLASICLECVCVCFIGVLFLDLIRWTWLSSYPDEHTA